MLKCFLCQSEKTHNQIFQLLRCKHQCCYECLCNYVSKNLKATVKCPVKNCKTNISDVTIRECLSNDLIDQYEAFSLSICSQAIHKCLTKSCPFYIMTENDSIIFHCSYCGQPNCLKCNKRHYPNEKCNRNVDEKVMNAEAEKNLKLIKRKQMETMDKENDLLSNCESFECSICFNFILPRKGVTFRKCLDSFCKSCLDITFTGYQYINQFTCPTCKIPLEQRESVKLFGLQNIVKMSINERCYKHFICQSPDCENYWSCTKNKGVHKCEKCGVNNCLSCKAIHNGKTCKQYLNSDEYKSQKYISEDTKLICYYCGKHLVKNGGCGALTCNHCNNVTCEFTGKEPGNEGCNCKSNAPCHINCKHGCIPH